MESTTIISFFKSLTILLPLIVGLIRFKNIDEAYRPFIFYLLAGFVTEIVSFILIDVYHTSNAVLSNVYILAEWLLIVWQFYCWGIFKSSGKKKLYALSAVLAIVWITENIVAGKLTTFSPYFRVLYSFAIVIMSISIINYTIIHHFENIFRNARFLVCLGFIIFFIYKMVFEWAFQISSIRGYELFSTQVISWFGYVNALVNLIYFIAVLLFPARNQFTLK